MSRNVYDDWSITGSVEEKNLPGAVPYNAKTNSFIFIFSACLLLIIGLICQYSASYPQALENGLNNYYYFIKQLIYTCVGLVVAFTLVAIPEKILKLLCPVFMLLCLVALGINFFIKSDFLLSDNMMNFVFFSQILYLGLFFANRTEGISRLREISIPILFSILFLAAILLQKNFAYSLLFLLITIVMFACGGVGTGGVVLLLLYAIVPSVCWILSDETNLRMFLNLLVPGYYNTSSATQYVYAQSSIVSGGILGKGLGMGEFKYGLISGISEDFIFCNICEEFGLVGSLFVLILFVLIAWSGYRCASRIKFENRFLSNCTTGLTTLIVWQAILNILSVFGIIPIRGFSLPFFSSGIQIILTIVECALIYKSTFTKVMDSYSPLDGHFELESGYDIENC